MAMNLDGKRIVVIGGSSGIGLATATMAVCEGASVVIASRSSARLEKAAREIPGKVEVAAVDVRDESSVRHFFDHVGDFDHLTTPCAGVAGGNFLDLDLQAARKAFDSKFWGQYHAARYGAPRIRSGGSITLVSGSNSQRPLPQASVRAAVNSAVEGLARALAVELSPIRVNAVSPGPVDTPLHDHLPKERRDALFQAVAASLPVKRIGKAEEIAQTVLYLMTNGFTTGSTLYVDGGYTLR
jgi:NAD(P)-dependent dehydrogenase (short-subunit alcohol dehydrogenase family)